MEVQVDHAAVVTAHSATPAGLLDEYALDLLQPPGDRLTGAPLAAPAVPTLSLAAEMERHKSMPLAQPELGCAVVCWRAASLLD
jgi:hypothetical protein